MSTDQAMATDAANPLALRRGVASQKKQQAGMETQAFGALLDKAAMRVGQHRSIKTEADVGLLRAEASGEASSQSAASVPPEETEPEVAMPPDDDEPAVRDLPRSDTAIVRLTALFGAILPGTVHRQPASEDASATPPSEQKPAIDRRSVVSKARHEIRAGEIAPAEAELPPADAATLVAQHKVEAALHDRKTAPPVSAERIEPDLTVSGTVGATSPLPEAVKPAESKARDAAPVMKLEQVTVTKVETSFMPLAVGNAQQNSSHPSPLQGTSSASPLPPSFVALPEQTVVKTIELRLQPKELGDVKIAIHLRGDELRLQVEVSTREAHALLQRDKSALSQVLEKAGYELSETAVTLTLKPDLQPIAASNTGNDASAFNRNGSGGNGHGHAQSFQQQAGEQQQRSAIRRQSSEEPYDRSAKPQGSLPAGLAGSRDIYL